MKLAAILLLASAAAHAMPTNPAVTQATIAKTICVPNWSAKQRPPTSYTDGVKLRMMAAAGLPLTDQHLYELDHHVPISLGGAPRDPANLQLQKWTGADGATAKDVVEKEVHRRVCLKPGTPQRMTLAAAQSCMWADWHRCIK